MNVCLAYAGDLGTPSGGTDRVTAFAAGLADRGFEVAVVVPEPESELPEKLADVAVRTVETERFGRSNRIGRGVAVTRAAERVARNRDAVLQIEHSTLAGLGTLHLDEPFVLDMHDLANARFDHVDTPLAPALKRVVGRLERRAARRASHVIAVSDYMRTTITGTWGMDRAVSVVPNGYFADRIRELRGVERIPGRVSFLGTLHPKVDVGTIRTLADREAVSELVVVGDGAQRATLEEYADGHPTLRVTGRLPDPEAFEIVASSAVVINPQEPSKLQRSSSPVKIHYYAALGCPMVLTPGPAVVDELVGQDAARTAESGPAFVDAVRSLLGDPETAARLGTNALTAAKRFTWAERIDVVADIYERQIRR